MTSGARVLPAGFRGRALAVLALAALLFAWNAWGYDLWAPDEPYFGEGAREMVADGQWLVPHVLGKVTTDKPPLFFWLIALASLPLGPGPFAARLPSILAGLGCVALVIHLGRRFESERTGLLAGVILATSWLSWDKFRSAQIDGLLCLLVLATVAILEAWCAGDLAGRPAGLVAWGLAGLATLAKGPVGLIVPLGILVTWLAARRELRRLRELAPVAGPALFLAITLAWAIPATLCSGGEYSFLDALRTHFVDRAAHGMHHPRPAWYYLVVTPVQLLPWTGLALAGLAVAWRERDRPGRLLLLAWAGFVVVLFSLSREKRDLYVLPAFPAFALLAALAADHCLAGEGMCREGDRRLARWALGVPLAILVVLGLVLVPLVSRRFPGLEAAARPLAAVLIAGGGSGLLLAIRGRVRASVMATAAMVSIFLLVLVTSVYPAVDPLKSPAAIAAALEEAPTGARVGSLGLGNLPRAIAFRTGGIYPEPLGGIDEATRWLAAPGEAWLIAEAEPARELRERFSVALEEVARQRLARRDVVLLRKRP